MIIGYYCVDHFLNMEKTVHKHNKTFPAADRQWKLEKDEDSNMDVETQVKGECQKKTK